MTEIRKLINVPKKKDSTSGAQPN